MRLVFICAFATLLAGATHAQRGDTLLNNVVVQPPSTSTGSGGFLGGGTGGGDCSTATVTTGSFQAFTLAAGGSQTNPNEAICLHNTESLTLLTRTNFSNEEWWSWTDPSLGGQAGVATLEVCGLSAVNTKVAIYENDCMNMATLDPLACKDNSFSCAQGLPTRVTWDTVGGVTYLIQLGTSVTAPGGTGAFDITVQAERPAGQYDLGSSFNANGIGPIPMGGTPLTFDSMIGQTFDAGMGELVNSVDIAWGTPIAGPMPAVVPIQLVIYSGEPGSLVHLADQVIVHSLENTDTFVNYPLTTPVAVTGLYSVAIVAVLDNTNGPFFPFGWDDSVNSMDGRTGQRRAWNAIELASPPFDIMNPDGAQGPPQFVQLQVGQFQRDRVWMVRSNTEPNIPVFNDHCNGNGDVPGCGVCPCGNFTAPGTIGGCVNRSGFGTRLHATGDTSVSLPTGSGTTTDLRFNVDGLPPSTFGVLISGDAVAPTGAMNMCTPFNSGIPGIDRDGLRCAVMSTFRHGGRTANALGEIGGVIATSGSSRPWGGEAQPHGGIFTQGGFTSGQTRFFQLTHREDSTMVCGFGLNTSQAVEIMFTP